MIALLADHGGPPCPECAWAGATVFICLLVSVVVMYGLYLWHLRKGGRRPLGLDR